jgi:hypothetical protein
MKKSRDLYYNFPFRGKIYRFKVIEIGYFRGLYLMVISQLVFGIMCPDIAIGCSMTSGL